MFKMLKCIRVLSATLPPDPIQQHASLSYRFRGGPTNLVIAPQFCSKASFYGSIRGAARPELNLINAIM
ncbi:hypothetical protein PR002_g1002 [Phytophthora rubi]|uniref:Uncharacterized protein n=1 Tax=Phytophthora rubi TaxID=129364 RepID=A0A6A3NXM9_9STRA|nr:hypothetical protein PR002_g1002 [Phytophthora rubi]